MFPFDTEWETYESVYVAAIGVGDTDLADVWLQPFVFGHQFELTVFLPDLLQQARG